MITQDFLSRCSDEQINRGMAWLEVTNKNLSMKYNPDSEFYYYWCKAVMTNPNNYCTNPSDIMPIAFANRVDIRHNYNALKSVTALVGNEDKYTCWATNINPLRAIAEVYILMSVNK